MMILKKIIEVASRYVPDEIEEDNLRSLLHKIPKDEEDQLAKEIAFLDEYGKANNMGHRSDVARRKAKLNFEKKGYELDIRWELLFANKVEDIFNTEVKPKRDEKLKYQVAELKSQGLKKVQVASKLGVSTGTVNKFWELD